MSAYGLRTSDRTLTSKHLQGYGGLERWDTRRGQTRCYVSANTVRSASSIMIDSPCAKLLLEVYNYTKRGNACQVRGCIGGDVPGEDDMCVMVQMFSSTVAG